MEARHWLQKGSGTLIPLVRVKIEVATLWPVDM